MEFHEKLQELRKSRSLTQEELASALFVSRTAISKWESGRGYPSIDSLKEISRYFSVTIDELICSDEILSAAEKEKAEMVGRYLALICSTLDILLAMLLFIPVFRNEAASPASVSLFAISGLAQWVKAIFAGAIGLTVLNGVCGAIISHFDQPIWNRHRLVTGLALSIIDVALFLATRQPYAGIICFAFLIVKAFLVFKAK